MRRFWRVRDWLRRPIGRKRYVITTRSSTHMNWMTGEGTHTDYTTGKTEHFNAGPNPLGMPDWITDIVNKDTK
jgi:hypothetical protein